jgi:hypothetical protein
MFTLLGLRAMKVKVKNEICRMEKYSQYSASDYRFLVKNTRKCSRIYRIVEKELTSRRQI